MTSGGNNFNDFPENQLTSINHLPSIVYWLILAAKTFDRCYTGVCVCVRNCSDVPQVGEARQGGGSVGQPFIKRSNEQWTVARLPHIHAGAELTGLFTFKIQTGNQRADGHDRFYYLPC